MGSGKSGLCRCARDYNGQTRRIEEAFGVIDEEHYPAGRLVDHREREAKRRFEQLKNEMTARSVATELERREHGEM